MEYLKKEVEKSADELGLKEKQTIRVTSTAKMSDKI